MKTLITLLFITGVVLLTASCQKEEIVPGVASPSVYCTTQKGVPNSIVKLNEIGNEKQIQNAVACKACHSNRDINAVQ